MPGLLTLNTDLKSLKYGQDQPGGGSSNQPYIKTDINTIDEPFNRIRLTRFDDGLIRGGAVGAINASVTDTLRISKFFIDFPKGPLFLAKQVGLQLSNPRLEVPKNIANIASGGINNALAVSTNGLLEPTRVYNLGINTLLQVPINAIGGHILRHGLLPFTDNDSTKYEAIVTANNSDTSKNNRLVSLAKTFGLTPNTTPDSTKDQLLIDKYLGGPNSVYGIGNTLIHRAENRNTSDLGKKDFSLQQSTTFAGKTRDSNGNSTVVALEKRFLGVSNKTSSSFVSGSFTSTTPLVLEDRVSTSNLDKDKNGVYHSLVNTNYVNTLGVSKFYFNTTASIEENTEVKFSNPDHKPGNLDKTTYSNIIKLSTSIVLKPNTNSIDQVSTPVLVKKPTYLKDASYTAYQKIIESRKLTEVNYDLAGNPVNQFGLYGNTGYNSNGVVGYLSDDNVLPDATTYPMYSNGNEIVKIKMPWNKVAREIRVGSGRQDIINLTPMFDGGAYFADETSPGGKTNDIRDLVRFRIQAVNTDKPENGRWMVFRAYLTDLSDGSDATWNDVKYAGRGEKFYIYDGFSRKISVSFKVAALSAGEMKFIYQKLNFLMSNTMPDYSGTLMRGPLVRLSIGNWIDCQLGILNSVQFKIPQDSPWEIALDEPEGGTKQLILPHIVEVTLSFTPIGSETAGSNLIPEKSFTTSHIAQNNTGDTPFQYIE